MSFELQDSREAAKAISAAIVQQLGLKLTEAQTRDLELRFEEEILKAWASQQVQQMVKELEDSQIDPLRSYLQRLAHKMEKVAG